MKPLTNKTPKDCTTCGKKDPAEIHTCTPKDTIRQEPKTKEEIASSLMEDIECDDTKCPYTKTDGLHFHMERLEEKVVEALTDYRQSVLEEAIKLVEENRKGAFTDDGGNDCRYKDCLIDAINHLKQL